MGGAAAKPDQTEGVPDSKTSRSCTACCGGARQENAFTSTAYHDSTTPWHPSSSSSTTPDGPSARPTPGGPQHTAGGPHTPGEPEHDVNATPGAPSPSPDVLQQQLMEVALTQQLTAWQQQLARLQQRLSAVATPLPPPPLSSPAAAVVSPTPVLPAYAPTPAVPAAVSSVPPITAVAQPMPSQPPAVAATATGQPVPSQPVASPPVAVTGPATAPAPAPVPAGTPQTELSRRMSSNLFARPSVGPSGVEAPRVNPFARKTSDAMSVTTAAAAPVAAAGAGPSVASPTNVGATNTITAAPDKQPQSLQQPQQIAPLASALQHQPAASLTSPSNNMLAVSSQAQPQQPVPASPPSPVRRSLSSSSPPQSPSVRLTKRSSVMSEVSVADSTASDLMQRLPSAAEDVAEEKHDDVSEAEDTKPDSAELEASDAVDEAVSRICRETLFRHGPGRWTHAALGNLDEVRGEIVTMEQDYYTRLRTLSRRYAKPLLDPSQMQFLLLADQSLMNLFSHVQALLDVHEDLVDELLDGEEVEAVLANFGPKMSVYAPYITHYVEAAKVFGELKTNSRFQQFLRLTEMTIETDDMSLSECLLMPIRKLWQYAYLLQLLIKEQPADSSHVGLKAALRVVRQLLGDELLVVAGPSFSLLDASRSV